MKMRRVRVTFWTLVVSAIVSSGALMSALGWRSGPVAGITIAVSGAATAAATALAVRILIVLSRDHEDAARFAPRVNLISDDGRRDPPRPHAVDGLGATGSKSEALRVEVGRNRAER